MLDPNPGCGENLLGTNQTQVLAVGCKQSSSVHDTLYSNILPTFSTASSMCKLTTAYSTPPRPYHNLTSHISKCSDLIGSAVWRAENTTRITCCPQTLLCSKSLVHKSIHIQRVNMKIAFKAWICSCTKIKENVSQTVE